MTTTSDQEGDVAVIGLLLPPHYDRRWQKCGLFYLTKAQPNHGVEIIFKGCTP